mmetsp:Transcript_15033/g.37871  ORF Transcript_15033/g.37871 Transcript_15033/m.37871 type:complete len:304 (-) Transcript_15033:152-1063(-)
MGGDGGVIASNRKYMRGAGTADHTGDLNRHAAQKFNAQEAMKTCALTKAPLHTSAGSTIVADPYGSLYHKEAAVQALLTRKQRDDPGDASATSTIGPQVRRLADLYEVRFYREEGSKSRNPTCPITGKALTGSIPAILLVPGKEGMSNVVSESALSQLSAEELEGEYGRIRKRVRLAPNPVLLEKIKEQTQQEREKDDEERRKAKKDKKKDKKSKRKREGKDKVTSSSEKKTRCDENKEKKKAEMSARSSSAIKSSSSSVGKQIQSRVDSAIEKSSVLSSLFVNKSAQSKISEKEKKDNLFAR